MNKTSTVAVRFTPDERLKLMAAARKQKLILSKWVHAVLTRAANGGKEKH